MLQGVTWLQVDTTPIWDFWKSSRLNPTAWSMARLAARSGPSRTMEENSRSAEGRACALERLRIELFISGAASVAENRARGKQRRRMSRCSVFHYGRPSAGFKVATPSSGVKRRLRTGAVQDARAVGTQANRGLPVSMRYRHCA